MNHERVKVKNFHATKGIATSRKMSHYQFLTIVCWHEMIENSFKRCFLIDSRPLSSVSKSK